MKNSLTLMRMYLIAGSMLIMAPHLDAQRRGNGQGQQQRDDRGQHNSGQRGQVKVGDIVVVMQKIANSSTLQGRRFNQAVQPAIYELEKLARQVRDRQDRKAFSIAADKLHDRQLPQQRRVAISLDALKNVVTGMVYSTQLQYQPQGVLILAKLGKLLSKACLFGQAKRIFVEVEDLSYGAIGQRRVANQIAKTAKKAQKELSATYYATPQLKAYAVIDLAEKVIEKIRNLGPH